MFADELLIKCERETQNRDDENVNGRVDRDLQRFRTGHPFCKIAQLRREFGSEQKKRDRRAEQKIPKEQPIAAFEISI